MDYVIAPCELPATIDARTLTALDACQPPSVVPRGEEGVRGPVVPRSSPRPRRGFRARRPSGPSDNGRSNRDVETADGHGDEPTGMDHPRTYLGRLTSHHASHRDGASSVAVRYDARTAAGASGAAVFETSHDGTYRRLVAMHRAGDPAAEVSAAAKHAEGLSIADIMRDVSEITAERAVRTGASSGDLRPAASELLLRPAAGVDGYESRVVAVAPPPPRCARRPNTRIARRVRRVIFPAAAATFTRERTPCSPRSKNGRSCPRRGPFDSQTPPRIWLVHSLERSSRSLALRNRPTPAGRAVEARRG